MPLLSRQPACGGCGHEEHAFFPCECGCAPHAPTGIYPEEA
jgi:hypothetical protein